MPDDDGQYMCLRHADPTTDRCENGAFWLDPASPEQQDSPFAGACMKKVRRPDEIDSRCWLDSL